MELLEAISARHSVRDFLPRPVPRETLEKILQASLRSPSGSNGQPWEIFVARGKVLERIRKAFQERTAVETAPPPAPASPPPAFIQERMQVVRDERLRLLGLDPADPASGKVFAEWRARLYGTPVLAVICADKALSASLDIGILVQTICLAAQAYGVDTLIAASLLREGELLRSELEIAENMNPVITVCLGYADPESIINTYRSPRRTLEDVVRWKE
jgi:nitroreductase